MDTKPTPDIDMTKVIARANKAPAAGRQPDMERVAIAARQYGGTSRVPAPRPVHMALPPVDAGRRRTFNPNSKHCSGFNHGSFFNSFS